MQSCGSLGPADIWIGPTLEKREEKLVGNVVVFGTFLPHFFFEAQAPCVRVVPPESPRLVNWRVPTNVVHIRVCSKVQKKFHHFNVAVLHGHVQRTITRFGEFSVCFDEATLPPTL